MSSERVAVVTGASRGIGKGIALELGASGATVYVTGRTVTAGAMPGTVGETAAEIDDLGGRGIAVACDHHDDDQVTALFDRVRTEQGRLDVLVNNVYSAPDLVPWLGKRFWELPVEAWDQVIDIGTRSHYVASVLGMPLLLAAGGGLIVNISSSGAVTYAHNVVYGVGKAAVDKMTADMAVDLEGTGVSVVSLWPGLVRTELLEMGAQYDGDQAYLELPGEGRFDLSGAESPRFLGRAVVALLGDEGLPARTGRAFTSAGLARELGFTDVDGRVPEVLLRPEA
ncbi:SDR family NAD(P)-dependent oxidoreductase [Rhabdothermincola salaria]|uniref:SDR family NAD(P)-dependent oxidoreductase n=1 Tax=Rhabdothermincola salaria TaxID=2903142 RepID=UPI001E416850|nr:SDR family NAD(P)-dependent oxidoreductase [Rhabdothermincola salaria]MCD9622901.1 SDR family NAD(P)-dependent oxidoreductase [Rhabdothermincola salaria]